jgi:hypothetical protein
MLVTWQMAAAAITGGSLLDVILLRFQTISLLTLSLAATATLVARIAVFTLALVLTAGCRRHAPTPAGEVFRSFDRMLLLEEKGETSSSANVGDLNGDALPDIVLGKGRHWPLYNRVLQNDGKGGFTATNLGTAPDRSYSRRRPGHYCQQRCA